MKVADPAVFVELVEEIVEQETKSDGGGKAGGGGQK